MFPRHVRILGGFYFQLHKAIPTGKFLFACFHWAPNWTLPWNQNRISMEGHYHSTRPYQCMGV